MWRKKLGWSLCVVGLLSFGNPAQAEVSAEKKVEKKSEVAKKPTAALPIPEIPMLPSGDAAPVKFQKPESVLTPFEMVASPGWSLYDPAEEEQEKAVSFENNAAAKLTRVQFETWKVNAKGNQELRVAIYAAFPKGEEVNDEFTIEIPPVGAKPEIIFLRNDRTPIVPPKRLHVRREADKSDR